MANDLMQEVFLKVVKNAGSYKEKGYFSTWVMTIARNTCLDYFRKENAKPVVSMVADLDVFNVVLPEAQKEIIIPAQFEAFIDKLETNQRETIILKFYAGLTFKRIAEIKNKSINTVQGYSKYGLIKLKKEIKKVPVARSPLF
ncbi:MAG: RNA polymerase sigma factor [Ferruginibacter sp.]